MGERIMAISAQCRVERTMPLWIFETVTIETMLADACHVYSCAKKRNDKDCMDITLPMIRAIETELYSRIWPRLPFQA